MGMGIQESSLLDDCRNQVGMLELLKSGVMPVVGRLLMASTMLGTGLCVPLSVT